jgi:UDP-2,4-diacetamido-2,4,6-trideoxy-beta-L-altropyranose hydrolase
MRCLTLANALKKNHLKVFFVARHIHAEIATLISEQGHEVVLLDYPLTSEHDDLKHSGWLRASQITDAKAIIDALKNQSIDWVIVDHYALDERWEFCLRSVAKKIMVIDDIADRQHDCDILLDQNYYGDMELRYQNKVPPHCKLILGPKYALLRDEFYQTRQLLIAKTGKVKRILITFGGVDAENYTAKAIHAITQLTEYELTVDVVIGAQHPNKDEIEQLCKKFGYICHVQTNKMAELMASADIAMAAGGATSWERCAIGLPSIIVSLADNQHEIAKSLDNIGVAFFIGRNADFTQEKLCKLLINACNSPEKLLEMSNKAFALVDGIGTKRVMGHLYENYSSLH